MGFNSEFKGLTETVLSLGGGYQRFEIPPVLELQFVNSFVFTLVAW